MAITAIMTISFILTTPPDSYATPIYNRLLAEQPQKRTDHLQHTSLIDSKDVAAFQLVTGDKTRTSHLRVQYNIPRMPEEVPQPGERV